jgi:hypothetical protein
MGEKKEENGEYSVALGSFWANKKGNKRKERNRIDRNLIGLPLAHSIGKEQGGGTRRRGPGRCAVRKVRNKRKKELPQFRSLPSSASIGISQRNTFFLFLFFYFRDF